MSFLLRSIYVGCRGVHVRSTARSFSILPRLFEKPLPPRIIVPETDIDESFLKGSGPGGQKINKTSSAVQLKHLPTGIVVKSQETRSRAQNRKIARRILAEKLEDLEKGDQSRNALKAEKARLKKASASKKSKRKYKKLEEEKTDQSSGDNFRDEDAVGISGMQTGGSDMENIGTDDLNQTKQSRPSSGK